MKELPKSKLLKFVEEAYGIAKEAVPKYFVEVLEEDVYIEATRGSTLREGKKRDDVQGV